MHYNSEIISKPDKAKAKQVPYKVPPRYHNAEYDVAGLLSTNFNNCCPRCNFKWSNKNDKLPLKESRS